MAEKIILTLNTKGDAEYFLKEYGTREGRMKLASWGVTSVKLGQFTYVYLTDNLNLLEVTASQIIHQTFTPDTDGLYHLEYRDHKNVPCSVMFSKHILI